MSPLPLTGHTRAVLSRVYMCMGTIQGSHSAETDESSLEWGLAPNAHSQFPLGAGVNHLQTTLWEARYLSPYSCCLMYKAIP